MQFPIRINKYLAEKKLSTRRGADLLIEKGLVFVNGKKARLGDLIEKDDKIILDKKAEKKYFYYAYNKNIGVSTNKDNKSKDILSVTKFPNKVFPIGRLDKDSHGLIILTNDGRITDRLLSPKYIHEKEYIVKVEPNFTDKFIELMSNGVRFDNYISKKCKVWRKDKSKNIFHIILTEGKKRQIREMFKYFGLEVEFLKRINFAGINLGNLKEGQWVDLNEKEIVELRRGGRVV